MKAIFTKLEKKKDKILKKGWLQSQNNTACDGEFSHHSEKIEKKKKLEHEIRDWELWHVEGVGQEKYRMVDLSQKLFWVVGKERRKDGAGGHRG